MALRDSLLKTIDRFRAKIPAQLGIRRFRVFVKVSKYSSDTTGRSAPDVIQRELLIGGYPPKVREIQMKDVIAGDSAMKTTIYEIGPLSAADAMLLVIDPQGASGQRATTQIIIKGQGLPTEGVVCQRIEDDTYKPFTSMLRVKTIGRKGV